MLNKLSVPIDISEIAQRLTLSIGYVRNLIQQLRRFNCLKYDYEGNIYGISDYGIEAMDKNKLI